MTRKMANDLGIKILGKVVSHTVCGVEPDIMGVGPLYAIPKVLANTGLTK